MHWRSRSRADTRALGRALGVAACAGEPPGGVVALLGPLGAGKTLLAKGVAEGLGLDPADVASPTFVIANEYETPAGVRLVHVDLYRVGSEAELEAAGWLDWLAPGTLVLVEWGDRLPAALPTDRLELRLRTADESAPESREIELAARGRASRALLARVAGALGVAAQPDEAEEGGWR